MLDAAGIAAREPHCRGIKAIFSPVTGIVDWGLVSRRTRRRQRSRRRVLPRLGSDRTSSGAAASPCLRPRTARSKPST
jgi:hypothetical protein